MTRQSRLRDRAVHWTHLKTVGQAFYIGKSGIEKISTEWTSGYTKWSSDIGEYLAKKFNLPRPPTTEAHVETTLAWIMRTAIKSQGIKSLNLNIVINNTSGICTGPYNCVKSVEQILPVGHSLTVWVKGAATGRVSPTLILEKGTLED
ncbi:DddA-like double-stranded DNA deaminase toxin [Kitasatospora sp. NPDC088351]|uniref:DddA-like double-stranded DNA deaminase toxin n=1 Tax=Kitasatospora sp. NPDC088351 TaxID=3155180 RepID=UPI003434DFAC